MKKKLYRYNAWKTNDNFEPIEGTDRILTGPSKRWIVKHLASEEGVEYKNDIMMVKCKDDTLWFVSKI